MINVEWIKNIKIRNFIKLTSELIDKSEKDHVFLISAGIAFNIILYLIPLLLLAVYVFNMFVGADKATNFLINTADDIIPHDSNSIIILESVVREVNLILVKSQMAGFIGLITLLWLSSTLFSSIRSGLNKVFNIQTPRIFFFYKIKDILTSFILAILILVSSYFVPLVSVGVNYFKDMLKPPYNTIFSNISVTSFTILTSIILFYPLFKFIPNKKMPTFIVNLSTIICVIVIEISRNLFAWYVSSFGTYGKFYGTYAVLVSIAFWIYYMILIMMISAEIGLLVYEYREKKLINPA